LTLLTVLDMRSDSHVRNVGEVVQSSTRQRKSSCEQLFVTE